MAQARQLLNASLALSSQGDLGGAIEKLKTAQALAHTPIISLELGRAYSAVGKLVEARETLLSVARLPVRPEETGRSRAARTQSAQLAEQLRPRIPTLSITIKGAASSPVTVTMDGIPVSEEALSAPRLVNPGPHTVAARSAAGATAEAAVDLKESEARELVVTLPPLPAPPPEAGQPSPATAPAVSSADREAAAPTSSKSGALALSLLGAGGAVAIAGGVLMGVEIGRAKDAANSGDRPEYNGTKTPWAVGLVGVIVGGAAVASSGIVFAASTGSSSTSAKAFSPWVSVGVNRVAIGGAW
jgi:hypothetical protein